MQCRLSELLAHLYVLDPVLVMATHDRDLALAARSFGIEVLGA